MPRYPSFPPLGPIFIERDSPTPLYRQVYNQIRESILAGQLVAGTRLPPTRALAKELTVSRNTVMIAFDQLLAEGYIESRVGQGSFVSSTLPDEILQLRTRQNGHQIDIDTNRPLSSRGRSISSISIHPGTSTPGPFRSGVPALDVFPFKMWERLADRNWRKRSAELLCYGHVGGYRPLREAIAAYLGATRGVNCRPEQVIVVTGAQQGMYLAAQLLLDPGDGVWVEDPGYPNARRAMLSAAVRLVPVPLDDDGIDVAAGIALGDQGVKMAIVTPSYQYPLGISMSLSRRLALLEWANRTGSWILEDDYDSEYRYAGRPLAALQGLDQSGRVIYVGTFSKVLFPSLRIGYLIVPPDLIKPFTTILATTNRNTPTLDQVVLADFINDGHFVRHVRRMRMLYAERQAALIRSVNLHLAGIMSVAPADAGLHLIGWLSGVDDRHISRKLAAGGIYAAPLSDYATQPLQRKGLILGYAGIGPDQIEQGVKQMANVFGSV